FSDQLLDALIQFSMARGVSHAARIARGTPVLNSPPERVLSLRGPVRALPRSPDAATLLPPLGAEAPAPSQEFLSTREAAALLGVTVKGLEAMRAKGRGPKFTRVGKVVRYRRTDLV
ncbi:MAG TPA: helix-turn-helix domain-containing protein, partial [Polyangiaceae bacterium]|nr:helix-turn-helix domain-containing protein [Polyangiaceae bacterium]